MLFNSPRFLLFLPIVLIAAALPPLRLRNRFLLVASYYFYGCWDWRFLGLLFLTTVVDYNVAKAIAATDDETRRRRLLVFVITVNLTVLGFFKYYNFFVDSGLSVLHALGLQAGAPALKIILPVGISFYTFQSMAYSIDVYRRQFRPVQNFLDYALFVAYFPQLVAGPISRPAHLAPQLLAPARLTPERINTAITLVLIGFAKKVLIADLVASEVARIFDDPAHMSSGILLRGVYLFAFQVYGDFSGYSDIARGVSELFGVRLMVNFNQPYLSTSITEFWRRWHMSLSNWLRDYVYIPLGSNRHGKLRMCGNLFLTMLICGLWHGANWTFVVWGGLNGAFLAIEAALGVDPARAANKRRNAAQWAVRLIAMVVTFHLVTFLNILFRSPDLATALQYIEGLMQLTHLSAVGFLPFLVGAALLLIDVPQYVWRDHAVFLRVSWWIRSPVYLGLFLGILTRIFYAAQEMPFIYFQF